MSKTMRRPTMGAIYAAIAFANLYSGLLPNYDHFIELLHCANWVCAGFLLALALRNVLIAAREAD